MNHDNVMKIEFLNLPVNERFAMDSVVAFVSSLNPTLEEVHDIEMAVSEAVMNSIYHAYGEKQGKVTISVCLKENTVTIQVKDRGKGINNVAEAKKPLFTTAGVNHAGMGFSIMEHCMDSLNVRSECGKGTTVIMKKKLRSSCKKIF